MRWKQQRVALIPKNSVDNGNNNRKGECERAEDIKRLSGWNCIERETGKGPSCRVDIAGGKRPRVQEKEEDI